MRAPSLLFAATFLFAGCDQPTGPDSPGMQLGDGLAFTHVGAIDQQQVESEGASSCPIDIAGRIAQGVTPAVNAWAQVSLLLAASIDTDGSRFAETITLDVREGSPAGPLLASSTVAIPVSRGWADFHFDPPVAVTPGSLVYLDLDIRWFAYWSWMEGDPYAGGSPTVNCLFEIELPDRDYTFITYAPIALPADSDGDGLPDAQDPDVVVDVVDGLSDSAFRAPGHRTAIASHLEEAEAQIKSGDFDAARRTLENLRRHVDGCELGAEADNDDWISDCAAQAEVRTALDALLAALTF